ncbi:hypothetical protein B0T25DRAFT_555547 [Lasiosphaeria hispida]|uniref:Myb-like DNA-binding domain-containing protein n=1 Tax=Lasiosphaeria hispida TaxID=260671 RepID=A0AAJ0H8X1_9PEZI|nr:hypothetical protein B0T25DRAFT_555547 [Lasiosphaeria hispida]
MSANDNAMTRFLFAILQQKCLKDIDWNKVARDPILVQEITNGHAARMRYSRFKAAMLGIEPQRRNRTNPNRSRVSKKKKDDGKSASGGSNTKQKDGTEDESSNVNPEGGVKPEPRDTESASSPPSRDISLSDMIMTPKIKEERMFMPSASPSEHSYTHQLHLGGSPAPASLSDLQHQIQQHQQQQSRLHMRLLTPCSDSDVLSGFGSGAAASPSASDMLQHDAASFDFSPVPGLSPGPVVGGAGHDGAGHSSWHHHHQHHQQQHHTHPQNGYSTGFGMGMHGGYGAGLDGTCYGAFCEHGDDHHRHQHQRSLEDELGVHAALLEEGSQVTVKHEDWDTQSYH